MSIGVRAGMCGGERSGCVCRWGVEQHAYWSNVGFTASLSLRACACAVPKGGRGALCANPSVLSRASPYSAGPPTSDATRKQHSFRKRARGAARMIGGPMQAYRKKGEAESHRAHDCAFSFFASKFRGGVPAARHPLGFIGVASLAFYPTLASRTIRYLPVEKSAPMGTHTLACMHATHVLRFLPMQTAPPPP